MAHENRAEEKGEPEEDGGDGSDGVAIVPVRESEAEKVACVCVCMYVRSLARSEASSDRAMRCS